VKPKSAGRERIDALFVQSATRFTSAGGTVTLHGLAESTVYFAERPRREIGHLRSSSFIELWDVGVNSFAVDPPNAVLSFLDDAAAHEDVVVVLHDPRIAGGKLTYRVDVLEGALPGLTGPCAVFIDAFGRPLSPSDLERAAKQRQDSSAEVSPERPLRGMRRASAALRLASGTGRRRSRRRSGSPRCLPYRPTGPRPERPV
jgi:hypothetical protein